MMGHSFGQYVLVENRAPPLVSNRQAPTHRAGHLALDDGRLAQIELKKTVQARRIVEAHRGKVHVVGQVGHVEAFQVCTEPLVPIHKDPFVGDDHAGETLAVLDVHVLQKRAPG